MDKIKVGAVSYLNTKPLLFGIEQSEELRNEMDLMVDYPSRIATLLLNNEIDLGLVPVAIIPKMKEHFIVSDYCIGAIEGVASVALFSEVPLHNIQKVLLDYQSNTSINLARVLMRFHWNMDVELLPGGKNYISEMKGATAGVVIGDRALHQRKISPYIYDLAKGWIEMTGLPFVFAAWIANKKLPDSFIQKFNEANGLGFEYLDEVIAQNPFPDYDLNTYYRKNLSFQLDGLKRKGLSKFLQLLEEMKTEKAV